MKQKSLITLLTILSLTAKVVSGCTYDTSNGGVDPSIENGAYAEIYFYSSVALILAIFITYFLRRRNGLWLLITTFAAAVIAVPVLIYSSILVSDCGSTAANSLKVIFLTFTALFVIQIISWILQKRKPTVELP